MKQIVRISLALCLAILSPNTITAQITTAGISGEVTAGNEEAIGATVTAKHVPSGTVYRAITNIDGHYTISGMRAGGPYEVEISYIGFQTGLFTDVELKLGEISVIDAQLHEAGELLQEVMVIGRQNNTMRSDRSGAVANLNAEAMSVVPTIGRSMTDIMKMMPQSGANGLSVGGGNFRQSNVTIDGASFNNAFGLDETLLPGGGTPISLDALDQMTISVTPYDVRQSGFVGGGVNAVTRSGTNQFRGSVYTYITSSSLKGSRVGNTSLPITDGRNDTYGMTFGGPILKDKLFFFVNAEIEDNKTAGPMARAGDGGTSFSSTSRRPMLRELEGLSDYLRNTYGLETGPWQDYSVKTPAYRILARLDWNINDNHRFNIRFTKSNRKNSNPATISRTIGSSQETAIYNGSRNNYGSNTNYGMSSFSSRYYSEFRFTTLAAELNSTFGQWHNTLRGTYSFQDQPRSNEYGVSAPVVEIVMNDGQGHYPSWALMGDIYTYGNLAQTKTTVLTDEVNVTLGKHNLFAGLQYEHNYASNGYAPAAAGYYVYEATPEQVALGQWGSVFGAQPRFFALSFGNNPNRDMFTSEMKTNQWSFYLQDNITWSERFRMSLGVRFELPSYPSLHNNFNQDFYDIDYGGRHYRTDAVPSASVSFSPRIGFNWDLTGQRRYILRGGTGLFVGRMPFVWPVSAVGNSGMGQTTYVATAANGNPMPTFTTSQADMFAQVKASNSTAFGSPTILNEDLRMPKTWKASLAFDAKLPGGIDFTLEGIYNRDLNPIVVANADIYWDGTSTIDLGHGDVRHMLSYYDPNHAPYVLENAGSKAYYLSLSAQLRKSFDFGLNLAGSFTLSRAKSYSEGIGDQVASAYTNYRSSINAVNDNELGYSTYVAPSRLLLSASYQLRESKHATNTFSLIYDGYQYGYLGQFSFSRYSYTFSSNINGDPTAPGNLIYVPASREELNSWDFADNGKVDGDTYTADMQRDDFWHFICQDDYLSTRKGQYAERGGAKMPWHHQLDFKYTRDMHFQWGKTKHTLQLGLDILNLPNFLCKDWGVFKQITGASLLTYKKGQYTYNLVDGQRHLSTTQNFVNAASTYQIMFTIKYLFN